VKIDTVKNSEIVKLFNQISLLKEFKTKNLAIKIYQCGNETGSADFNNGEITHDIFFAVSEFDELPNQSLFVIRNLYSVEIVSTDNSNDNYAIIMISYIEKMRKELIKLELTINELKKASR
jgi:hypothetical protein